MSGPVRDIDQQWPSDCLPPPTNVRSEDPARRLSLRDRWETWLSDRWQVKCLLMPSARAGIALTLRYLNIGRAHTLFAPAWSSHCVWDVLGRFGNPTCSNAATADVVLAVHKYARPTTYTAKRDATLIEDPCDALLSRGGSLFPNDGRFSVVSLPKIAGMWCGGVLAARDTQDADALGRLRDSILFDSVAEVQGRKRYLAALGQLEVCSEWSTFEFKNVHPDLTCLEYVDEHLAAALARNAATIEARLQRLAAVPSVSQFAQDSLATNWLPPVLAVPVGAIESRGLMQRHVSLSGNGDAPTYEACNLIPLHYAVSEAQFDVICQSL